METTQNKTAEAAKTPETFVMSGNWENQSSNLNHNFQLFPIQT